MWAGYSVPDPQMRLLILFTILPVLVVSPAAIVVAFSSADTRTTEDKVEFVEFIDSREVLSSNYWDSNAWEPDSADSFWHNKASDSISSQPQEAVLNTAHEPIPGKNTKQTDAGNG